MKGFGILFWFLMVIVAAASSVYLGGFGSTSSTTSTHGPTSITKKLVVKHAMASPIKSRKLKEEMAPSTGRVNLNDYGLIDPVPSSIASIRPGPIQHGTPLMPYIPRSTPPPPTDRD
ncbi:uncharacterized protein [Primulina huaijiensis]|uniref:uncharacterized protein n=1 Tax=Primulina huaijiensis TaxID=1492673 RepID=UPI003CC7446D